MLVFSAGKNANKYRLRDIRAAVKPTAAGLSDNLLVASPHVGCGESGIMELKLDRNIILGICRDELSWNFRNNLITISF